MADNDTMKLGSSRAKLTNKLESYKKWKHTATPSVTSKPITSEQSTSKTKQFRNLHDIVGAGNANETAAEETHRPATTASAHKLAKWNQRVLQQSRKAPVVEPTQQSTPEPSSSFRKKNPVLHNARDTSQQQQSPEPTPLRKYSHATRLSRLPATSTKMDSRETEQTSAKIEPPKESSKPASASLANKAALYKQKWKKTHNAISSTASREEVAAKPEKTSATSASTVRPSPYQQRSWKKPVATTTETEPVQQEEAVPDENAAASSSPYTNKPKWKKPVTTVSRAPTWKEPTEPAEAAKNNNATGTSSSYRKWTKPVERQDLVELSPQPPRWRSPNSLVSKDSQDEVQSQNPPPPPPTEEDEPEIPQAQSWNSTGARTPKKISRSVAGYWQNRSIEPSPVHSPTPRKSPAASPLPPISNKSPIVARKLNVVELANDVSPMAERSEVSAEDLSAEVDNAPPRSASKLKDVWNSRASVESLSPAKKKWGTPSKSPPVQKRWTVGPTDDVMRTTTFSTSTPPPPPFWKTHELIMKKSPSGGKTPSPSSKSASTKSSEMSVSENNKNVIESPMRRRVSDMASLFNSGAKEESSVVSGISKPSISSKVNRKEDDATVGTEKSGTESTLESGQQRPRRFGKSQQPSWVKNQSIPEQVDIIGSDMEVSEEPDASERSIVSNMKAMFDGGKESASKAVSKWQHSPPARSVKPSWIKPVPEEETETTANETDHVDEAPMVDETTQQVRASLPAEGVPKGNDQSKFSDQGSKKPSWVKSVLENETDDANEAKDEPFESAPELDPVLETIDSTYHDRDDSFEDIQALGTVQSSQSEFQKEQLRSVWAKPVEDEVEDQAAVEHILDATPAVSDSHLKDDTASGHSQPDDSFPSGRTSSNARLKVVPAVSFSGKPSWVKPVEEENRETSGPSLPKTKTNNSSQGSPWNHMSRLLDVANDADISPDKVDPVESSGIGERQGWESPRAARLKAKNSAKNSVPDRFVDGLQESGTNKDSDIDQGYISTDTESRVSVSETKAKLFGTGTEDKLAVPQKHSLFEFRAKQTKKVTRPLSTSPPPNQVKQRTTDTSLSPPRTIVWPPKQDKTKSPPPSGTEAQQNTPSTPPLRGFRARTDVSTPSGPSPPMRDSVPEKDREDLMCPVLPPMDDEPEQDGRGYSYGRTYKSNVDAALGDAMGSFARRRQLEESNSALLPPRPSHSRNSLDPPDSESMSHGGLQVDLTGKKTSPTRIDSPPDEPISMPSRSMQDYKSTIDSGLSSQKSVGRSWPPRAPTTANYEEVAAFDNDDSDFSEVIDTPPTEDFDEEKYTYSASEQVVPTISPRSKAQYPWNKDVNTLSPSTWQRKSILDRENRPSPDADDEVPVNSSTKLERSPNLQQLALDSNHAVDYEVAMATMPSNHLFEDDDDHSHQSGSQSPRCLPDAVPPEFEKAISGEVISGDEQASRRSKGFGDPSSYCNLSVAERAKALASWNGGLGVSTPPVDKQQKYRQEIGLVSSKFKQWEEKKEDPPAAAEETVVPEELQEDYNFDEPGTPFSAAAWTTSSSKNRNKSSETGSLGYLFDKSAKDNDQLSVGDSKHSNARSTLSNFDPFGEDMFEGDHNMEFSENVEFTDPEFTNQSSDFFDDGPTFTALAPPSGSMEDKVWSYDAAEIPSYDADTSSLNISDTAVEI